MTTRTAILSTVTLLAAASTAMAQFNSGSDGSDGCIDLANLANCPSVTCNGNICTLPVPEPDGIFHATYVNVPVNMTLKFTRNAKNTPISILATGDITIFGTVDVSGANGTASPPVGGKGGPGGFDGGMPAFGAGPPANGHGPGGGKGGTQAPGAGQAGRGAYRTSTNGEVPNAQDGTPYGSGLLVPLVGGSGGGGSLGQPGIGGGGGAILLASNTKVHVAFGTSLTGVRAQGGNGVSTDVGAGSGGAVRIVAPVVTGAGTIGVYAFDNGNPQTDTAGNGRIRIDAIDRTLMGFNFRPAASVSVGAYMVVFPPNLPKLDIIEAAGQIIPEDNPAPVEVLLPFGSNPNQTITVQGRDFAIPEVPITVTLIPEYGDRIVYDVCLDMAGGNVAQLVVPVTFPINTLTHIQAWTPATGPPCP